MESNRPDNYGKEQQQQKGARKRKLNECASANEDENDEQLLAEECREEAQPENCSKRNRQNDELDFELESLSREELIKMVRQMRNDQNTGEKKQLDAAKKEEHQESSNANQQDKAKEQMVRNMDEFKMAFLASQQKLEDLNAEMEKLNANYRKLFEEKEATGIKTAEQIAFPIRHEHEMKIQLAKETCYMSTSVIDLLKKFQQNSLFGNVNLDLHMLQETLILPQTLSNVLPLINNINSILVYNFAQMVNLYNSGNELALSMLQMTRFLAFCFETFDSEVSEVALLWLYTPREDGRPRVLILNVDFATSRSRRRPNEIPLFIDGIKKEFAKEKSPEFSKAKRPVSFFIVLYVFDFVEWHDSSMENATTKEMLVIKKVEKSKSDFWEQKMALLSECPELRRQNMALVSRYPELRGQKMALVSRYPVGAAKQWIEANEREAIEWNFDEQNGRIYLRDIEDEDEDDLDSDDDDQSDGNNCHNDDDDVNGSDDQCGSGPNYGDR